ncbi:MAG: hypothetical protein E7554_02350 [Ruminococcaceae bacterium]|nr:hypothetical protein [Oscillospiraceae bacterium]
MATAKQPYRRLQVKNVWTRTIFEIVAIVFAIIFCCVTIVSAYEKTYSDAAEASAQDNAVQLAHSISHLVDREAVDIGDKDRRDYVAGLYTKQLDSCFIAEDTLYTGGVYTMVDGQPVIYAEAQRYDGMLEEHGLVTRNDDGERTMIPEMETALRNAFTGIEGVVREGDVCIAFVPSTDESDAMPYAVTAVSVVHRDSFDYNSTVSGRIVIISLVVGVLIVGYYLVSALITEKNRIKEKAVNEL